MERVRSLGVSTLVALMAAHRALGQRRAPGAERQLQQVFEDICAYLDKGHAPCATSPDGRAAPARRQARAHRPPSQ